MGNVIKSAVNSTLSFFRRVKEVICDAFNAVATVVVNGVKTVVNYFKKILEYTWNGIKILGKLLYVAGKKLIHLLTNKLGIPYLIQYFLNLKNKGIKMVDETTNKESDPISGLAQIAGTIKPNSQIKVGIQILDHKTEEEGENSIMDFKENDDLEGIGLHQTNSVAIIGEREINLDTLPRVNTSRSNSYYPNYSKYSNYSNYSNHYKY